MAYHQHSDYSRVFYRVIGEIKESVCQHACNAIDARTDELFALSQAHFDATHKRTEGGVQKLDAGDIVKTLNDIGKQVSNNTNDGPDSAGRASHTQVHGTSLAATLRTIAEQSRCLYLSDQNISKEGTRNSPIQVPDDDDEEGPEPQEDDDGNESDCSCDECIAENKLVEEIESPASDKPKRQKISTPVFRSIDQMYSIVPSGKVQNEQQSKINQQQPSGSNQQEPHSASKQQRATSPTKNCINRSSYRCIYDPNNCQFISAKSNNVYQHICRNHLKVPATKKALAASGIQLDFDPEDFILEPIVAPKPTKKRAKGKKRKAGSMN